MRSHAKASSAAPIQRQATGLVRFVRGPFAVRGVSSDADGRGAPSRRRLRRAAVLLPIAALALLAFASPSQAKYINDGFGASGTTGGQFSQPRGIDLNRTGNGGVAAGTTYVVDSQNRVQRFSPSGAFERTWGENVSGRDEQQVVTIDINAIGGTFTLTFDGETTAPIDFLKIPGTITKPTSTTVRNALTALPSIGAGNVTVSGGSSSTDSASFTVRFTGALGGTDVSHLSIDTSELTGVPPLTASVSTLENGSGGPFAGFEICTESAECQEGLAASSTANGGQLNNPQGIAVNQTDGHVYITEQSNRRVSEFDADGNFVRLWGWDVVSAGGVGNVSANAFEICTVAADCKQAATNGADGGRFAAQIGYPTVDSSNNVWIPDATNRRIQEFDSTGNFIAAYGYDVDKAGGGGAMESCTSTAAGACQAGKSGSDPGKFGNNNPKDVAFDALGNVYALDSTNSRVQKFDPTLLASVADFATGTLPSYTTSAPDHLAAANDGTYLALVVNNNVTASPGERQVIEIDPGDESVKDTSLVGAGLTGTTAVLGLAEGAAAGSLLLTSAAADSPRKVLELSDTPPDEPVASLDPVTAVGGTEATFTALVDPNGGLLSCQFEYSQDSDFTMISKATEVDCDAFTPLGGAHTIGESVAGLKPGAQYFVRLSVSRPLAANSTTLTATQPFTTDPVPPAVSDVGTTDVDDTSVRLVGTIDGSNSVTGYVFRYGATPALGSSTAPVDIGDGSVPKTVSQVVEGLEPDTTYYFKLVATNLAGETVSATKTFTTRVTPFSPPDGRAYEQVTPVDKTYGDADFGNGSAAASGNGAATCTLTGFGDPPGQVGLLCAPYVSLRTVSGWQTRSVNAPYCANDVTQGSLQFGTGISGTAVSLSSDFHSAFITQPEQANCPIPPLDPAASLPAANVYRAEYGSSEVDYSLLLPSPAFGTSKFNLPTAFFAGAGKDFSTVVLHSSGNQTSDAPTPGNFTKIYSWHDDGSVNLVSKDTNDVPFTTDSAVVETTFNPGAVSDSGDRILFFTPISFGKCSQSDCDIYMRENETTTYNISESECTSSCGEATGDQFRLATPDGSKVFFTSSGKLTDDDTSSNPNPDLFMYTHSANPASNQNLTLLSADDEPADGNTGDVEGVVGASDDGNVVYFVANGQLVAGAPIGLGAKLYRWTWNEGAPTLSFLATLSPEFGNAGASGDTPVPGGNNPDEQNWAPIQGETPGDRAATPDGSYVMITTRVPILPAVDRDSDRDVYRWGVGEGWRCASCQAPGVPSTGDATVPQALPMSGGFRIYMSDDGRIVFETPDALVGEDTNGSDGCPPYGNVANPVPSCQDVYEWNGGVARLISSGLGQEPASLVASSSSGDDVFFFTRERLVGWDTDKNVDMYDARIGGGFPEPPPQGAPCEGDACRAAGTSAPNSTGAGTAVFQGSGNRPSRARKRCPKGKRRVRRHGRVRCVRRRHRRRQIKHRNHTRHRTANHNRRASR